jgi:hypothetical protein
VSYYSTLTSAQLKQYGQAVAAKYQVPWPIFNAMITLESGWNPSAQSPMNSDGTYDQGIAQINTGTAPGWNVNPWDPFAALDAAAMHLSEYYTEFGNSWSNALAAYNGGGSAQGVRNGIAAGYPGKVLAIAGSSSSSASTPATGSSGSASTSSSGGNPYVASWMPQWMKDALGNIAPATAATQSANQAGFLQSLHDLPFGVGPGVESIVSAGIVLTAAIVLVSIGGIWIIMGNQSSRSIVVNTAKTAAKAAAA